jgi:hypothetical protein
VRKRLGDDFAQILSVEPRIALPHDKADYTLD